MIETTLVPAAVTAFVGFLTSIAFEYVPGLKDKYGALKDVYQKLIMLGLGAVVVGGAYGLSCANAFGVNTFACDWTGGQEAILVYIAWLGGNQGTYSILLNKNKD